METENGNTQANAANPTEGMSVEEQLAYYRGQAKLWQDKHNGMQGHTTKVKTELDALKQSHDAYVSQTTGELTELQSKLSGATKAQEAFQSQLATISSERDTLMKRGAVTELIGEKFPELSQLYKNGLIVGVENLESEEQVNFLTKYSETLQSVTGATVKKDVSGSVPQQASQRQSSGKSLQQLQLAMDAAIRKPGGVHNQEYKDAYAEFNNFITNSAQR